MLRLRGDPGPQVRRDPNSSPQETKEEDRAMTNPNPIVHRGPCRICGEEVALFEADAEEYLRNVVSGLVHFECQTEEQ